MLRFPAREDSQRRVWGTRSEGFSEGLIEGKAEEAGGEWGGVVTGAPSASWLWPPPEPELIGKGLRMEDRVLLLGSGRYHKANVGPGRLGSSGREQLLHKCRVPKA